MSSYIPSISVADLLARVPLFAGLTVAQMATVAASLSKRRYKRGEAIVAQGATSRSLYVIVMGSAKVIARDSHGKEVILAMLQVGDYVGEMSVIDGKPHSADVVADVPTDALVLSGADLLACLKESPAMAIGLMRGLVGRLRAADEKIESLALMDVYGRVARVLLDMSVQAPTGERVIKDKVSKQTVAKMIGASREMVTRVFKDLEKSGAIVLLEGGAMRVQDRITSLL